MSLTQIYERFMHNVFQTLNLKQAYFHFRSFSTALE